MTFVRTNSGLSNFHAFFGVEYIVYSEGGDPKKSKKNEHSDDATIDEVWSIDSIFWRSVFSKFLPGTAIKIKSLGSKDFVRPYAEKIQTNSIKNSIAVFDRDYDCYRGEIINHPRVLYTYGYSWENDACRPEFLISILGSVHPSGTIPAKFSEEIRFKFDLFLKSINRVVFVDLLCGLKRIKGVDREQYWGLIDTSSPSGYKVKKDKFKALIQDIKLRRTVPLRYSGHNRISAYNDCYGKMVSMFCYSVFCDYYKLITGQKNIPRHFADNMMAQALSKGDLNSLPELRDYYQSMMARINV
ncbi:DUF4435 domain-containing protein [Pseudomonas taiwanensis]|uniref:DUF4435 domain-containing protein n=1 Tax=Pseudomonas taiwanensis TaxID=470150 RepID=UPI0028DF4CB4|nr:DUF4435 domain-containing protein [Pseudomonas taiwanensis]MDT8922788.1 DUF4435 domain-containing protein [Pseudomonas taiwanensis]